MTNRYVDLANNSRSYYNLRPCRHQRAIRGHDQDRRAFKDQRESKRIDRCEVLRSKWANPFSAMRQMSNLVCKRFSADQSYCHSLLICVQELLDRIGKQYQPIVNMMAEDTRPGWELVFEDGQPATDDNWAKRLAANNLITMNLELRWKSPLLLPPPPGPGGYKGPLSTTQTALSPFGVSHPGYGPYGVIPNSSFGGLTPNPFSYTPQSYTPGSYPQLGYPASYMATPYPVPAPPSSVSDVSRPARTTQPKLLKSKEDELEELIEKTDKLKAKLSGQDLSEAQVKDIAYLAHLELELYKVEKSSLERAARARKEKAEREALEREVAERVEEVRQFRHQMLKELHPIEFTDCLSRYFKFPFVSCQSWPVCILYPFPLK